MMRYLITRVRVEMKKFKMKNNNRRKLLLPTVVLIFMITGYSRLTGTEHIRSIHIVTLLVMGAAMGILLKNIITVIKEYRG